MRAKTKAKSRQADIQQQCSAACIRAGVTALVLAVFAITLSRVPAAADRYHSLQEFVALTTRLKRALDTLDHDPCWQNLKTLENAAGKDSETRTLKELVEYRCVSENSTPPDQGNLKFRHPEPVPSSPRSSPAPSTPQRPPIIETPQNARIETPISAAFDVFNLISDLADTNLIRRAREFSIRTDYHIYNWERLRANLTVDAVLHANRGKNVVIAYAPAGTEPNDAVRQNIAVFTVDNVRKLADASPFTIEEVEEMGGQFTRVGIPGLGSGLDYVLAILTVAVLNILSLIWFWLYFREATIFSGKDFPSPATVFGVFSRSQTSRVLFNLLLGAPIVAAATLAFATIKAQTGITAADRIIVVSCGVLSVLVAGQIAWRFGQHIPKLAHRKRESLVDSTDARHTKIESDEGTGLTEGREGRTTDSE
jgi:hypothetical protein